MTCITGPSHQVQYSGIVDDPRHSWHVGMDDMTVNGDLGLDGLGYANSNGHTLTDNKGCDSTLTYNEENSQSHLVVN